MINNVWINSELLISGLTSITNQQDYKERERIYDLWKTAYDTMEESNNDNHLDRNEFEMGYLTLKRSLNLRLKQLDKYFAFESIDYSEKNKKDGIFEVLEYFGITRKYTLRKYLNNRNQIEHYDINTISYEDGIAEAEFVWMFLKLTDLVLNNSPGFYTFTEYDPHDEDFIMNEICFSFEMFSQSNKKHKVSLFVFGNITPKNLSFKNNRNYFCVNNFKIITRNDY